MTIDKKTIQVCDTYNIIVNELAYYWHVTFFWIIRMNHRHSITISTWQSCIRAQMIGS